MQIDDGDVYFDEIGSESDPSKDANKIRTEFLETWLWAVYNKPGYNALLHIVYCLIVYFQAFHGAALLFLYIISLYIYIYEYIQYI